MESPMCACQSRCKCMPRHWIVYGSELSSVFAMQVSLVVNVASECGFTDQNYRALQQLQRDLGPYHFNVLAFPCNQFGQQEPDTNREIENFARRTYSVSFPMFSKIAVTGTGAHPAFKYLTRESCPFSSSPSLPGRGHDFLGSRSCWLAGSPFSS